jgi:hypothetical protein
MGSESRGVRIGDVRLVLALGSKHPCSDAGEDNNEEADEDGPAVWEVMLAAALEVVEASGWDVRVEGAHPFAIVIVQLKRRSVAVYRLCFTASVLVCRFVPSIKDRRDEIGQWMMRLS